MKRQECAIKKVPIQPEVVERPAAVTDLLRDWMEGDAAAAEQVLPVVYAQLRRIARRLLQGERRGHTWQTTAVVHEAFLELAETSDLRFESRAQFFGYCAHLMRRLLVQHSRRRNRLKRGGGTPRLSLAEIDLPEAKGSSLDVEELDAALTTLERCDPRKAEIVQLRVFGGLTINETAAFLDISTRTVDREWRKALAWLGHELSPDPGHDSP